MRIVLIDDEVVIVNGLKNMIARLRPNMDEISAFTEFPDLLHFLEVNPCDLLISDICMENCDGFHVIEQIKQKGLCKNFAIISGFDDFSYAKKSIEMSVVDYLLKPIEESELLGLIERVEKDVKESSEKETALLFKDFINGHIAYESLMQLEKPYLTAYEKKKCCVIRCSDKNTRAVLTELKAAFDEVFTFEGIFSVYYFVIAEEISLDLIINILKQTTVRFCVVSDVIRFKEAPEGYSQCKSCAEFRPFFTDKGVLLCSEIEHKQIDSFVMMKLNTEFFVAMQKRDSVHAKKILEKLFNEMFARKNLFFLERFISKLNDTLKVGAERIRFCKYPDCECLANAIIKSVDTGKKAEKTSNHFLLDMALSYIEMNYCKSITLAMVANEISVNYYYLSRLFKEQMKMNFKQYITEKRLERAAKLLKDPSLKVYEIAQSCGYENVNTFNEAFKCAYSITPTEYRSKF